ncbi:hypothetical protein AB0A71_04735 [Kitasatospora aureofaciens]|uniref:hypothetical protein n=1 Tax=Kitasatospora aureofaciens TaxID=1894 RepID=UPI0034032C33
MSDTDFPADLLELQQRWYTAEADWAADPTEEKRSAFAAVGARAVLPLVLGQRREPA